MVSSSASNVRSYPDRYGGVALPLLYHTLNADSQYDLGVLRCGGRAADYQPCVCRGVAVVPDGNHNVGGRVVVVREANNDQEGFVVLGDIVTEQGCL